MVEGQLHWQQLEVGAFQSADSPQQKAQRVGRLRLRLP